MNPETSRLNLSSLRDALALLNRALARWQTTGAQDEELRDACIQRFEYTFELSWKMLQRRLELDLAVALPWRVDLSAAEDLPTPLRELVQRHGVLLQGKRVQSQGLA